MKNIKKSYLVVIICLLIFGILTFVIAITYNKNNVNNNLNNNTNNINTNYTNEVSKNINTNVSSNTNTSNTIISNSIIKFERVTDYNLFFNVSGVINSLLDNKDDYDYVKDVLDESFIEEANISESSYLETLDLTLDDYSFTPVEMYKFYNQGVNYILVNGEINVITSEQDYVERNQSYLIIISKKLYSITPLKYTGDNSVYENNKYIYISSINSNSNNKYSEKSFSEKTIVCMYLNDYLNLYFNDNTAAYKLLGSNGKTVYPTIEDFRNDYENIKDKLSVKFLSYAYDGEDGKRTYKVKTYTEDLIVIKESNILEYTIDFQ